MKRDHYQDIGYKPFLFYLVFGVSAEELEVSQKRHKVDELCLKGSIYGHLQEKRRGSGSTDGFPVLMDL